MSVDAPELTTSYPYVSPEAAGTTMREPAEADTYRWTPMTPTSRSNAQIGHHPETSGNSYELPDTLRSMVCPDDPTQRSTTAVLDWQGEIAPAAPVFVSEKLQGRFYVKQKWEGRVLEVGQSTFRAHLVPLLGEDAELVADVYLSIVSQEDLVLLKPGAGFYWSIGDIKLPSGAVMHHSLIRFRRLPQITASEWEYARAQAEELLALADEQ